MNELIKIIICSVAAYWIGSISFSWLFSKVLRRINIYRVGTGLADASNVFREVSPFWGIMVWVIDYLRAYLALLLFDTLVGRGNEPLVLIIGIILLIGHCFPWPHRFRGGRGVITFVGIMSYFVPAPTILVGVAALFIAVRFHQVRFSQYMLVILIPIVSYFMHAGTISSVYLAFASLIMGVINFFVSRRYGEL